METFVVGYRYGASPEQLELVRPIHRQWLSELLAKGDLLASGPMLDNPEALLIFRADSIGDLAKLLDNDPFDIAGFIESRTIQRWNPVFGPFTS